MEANNRKLRLVRPNGVSSPPDPVSDETTKAQFVEELDKCAADGCSYEAIERSIVITYASANVFTLPKYIRWFDTWKAKRTANWL